MITKEVIAHHRQLLREAEAKGVKSVSTETLHALFDQFESQIARVQSSESGQTGDLGGQEFYRASVDRWNLESFRQVIALGQSALKHALLINAGAAVALLAFLGSLVASGGGRESILPFACSLRLFTLGVFFSAVAFATTYFSQVGYSGDKPWQWKIGVAMHIVTICVGIAALATFLVGALVAYSGFIGMAS